MQASDNMHRNGQLPSFPRPQRERWQPLRSGFLNIYRFDHEEFHYENGRLLLRGNNGTGKSRVLALQLPFLLDGEVISQRLEPDADPAKRVEWNLLMGRYPDRTGYTWIEFGRRDSGGKEHYITLGCGLSATEDESGVRKWFFVTTQRVGTDLELATEAKQVLGKDRLRQRIGAAGQVFEDVGAYRRAVNDALFRLDDYRYASLMNLLIQLRRPQLTRRLDENELSAALSEALPPVSPAIIDDVAEAFRNLESDRSKLESFRAALTGVERFLSGYRRYAEVAAKRRGDRVRAAHYEYESGMKEILTSEAECDRSLAELARLKAEIQHLSAEQEAVQAEIAALERSPQMNGARALEPALREAKEKRKEAESATAELADAVQVRKARSGEHVRIKTILERCELRLKTATDIAAEAAFFAGLEGMHRETIESLEVIPIRAPLGREYHGSTYHMTHRATVLVRLRTAEIPRRRLGAGGTQAHQLAVEREEHAPMSRSQREAPATGTGRFEVMAQDLIRCRTRRAFRLRLTLSRRIAAWRFTMISVTSITPRRKTCSPTKSSSCRTTSASRCTCACRSPPGR